MKPKWRFLLAAAALAVLPAAAAENWYTVALKKDFVKEMKDRATIEATFIVDHPGAPKQAKEDGDMHVAGRSSKVGLPMVAEVMNARQQAQKAIVSRLKADKDKETPQAIVGAWRLWFEHPGDDQLQAPDVPKPANTNPDHLFEIHPIVNYAGEAVPGSLVEVKGYTPHEPAVAFGLYEKRELALRQDEKYIILSSKKTVYNYARFRLSLLGKPKKLADGGLAAMAEVEDDAGETVARKVRMIFLAGTPPAQAVASLGAGDSLQVIGIPRVNLHAVWIWAQSDAGPITRKLPYEMIVVAVLKD